MPATKSSPAAGLHEYAFNVGLGSAFGGLVPVGGYADLGGSLLGGGLEAAAGGEFFGNGLQFGGLIGGIAGGGLQQGRRAVAWQGGGAVLGGGVEYAYGGDANSTLLGANLGSFAGGIAQGAYQGFRGSLALRRGVPSSLEGLRTRIDIYARRAELRALEKGLSGTEAGRFADRYLSKATYQLNRRLESGGSQYRALSQYGRDALGFEYFGNNRPAGTRFLDVALTNTDRSVVYSGWDARFQSTPYARWNTNAANAEYVRYFNIQEGFVREISVEAARP